MTSASTIMGTYIALLLILSVQQEVNKLGYLRLVVTKYKKGEPISTASILCRSLQGGLSDE